MPIEIPTDYRESYARARARHGALADAYLAHTWVGDPLADAVVEALAEQPEPVRRRMLQRVLDGEFDRIENPPAALERFVEAIERRPEWLDQRAIHLGCATFHRHSEMFMTAFVAGVLVEGFCTHISKSFFITGRLRNRGTTRLKRNNRHVLEIFMPGGLERYGDGWKLSVKIRLIHAQVRRLLSHSPDWDRAAWGIPLSTAHISFATSTFSALLLKRARQLGVRPSAAEREGFMQVWRYTAHLMGVPAEFLPTDEQTGRKIYQLGWDCEPPMTLESRILVHSLIQSAPLVIGHEETAARKALAGYVFRLSRAMVGPDLADKLHFPPSPVFGLLAMLRFKNAANNVAGRLLPNRKSRRSLERFSGLIDASYYSDAGLESRMPEHAYDERNPSF